MGWLESILLLAAPSATSLYTQYPHNRTLESEADYVGMLLMSKVRRWCCCFCLWLLLFVVVCGCCGMLLLLLLVVVCAVVCD